MQKYKTLVARCGYDVGTPVVEDLNDGKRYVGAKDPEMFMVRMPSGGSLYYKESELEATK